mmetsp:Transcript_15262/g.18012  ORF Transcript_15262/g.18012 Transcript_15262/m.18012 type:complete len:247 (+) Transcript_15262:1192-1932(+)
MLFYHLRNIAQVGFEPEQVEVSINGIDTSGSGISSGVCPHSDILNSICVLLVFGLHICAAVISYYTRNIPGLYSEAYFVMIATYNSFIFFFAIGITLGTAETDFPEREFLLALAFAWVTVTCALMIVGTRVFVAYKNITFTLQVEVLEDGTLKTVAIPDSAENSCNVGPKRKLDENYPSTDSSKKKTGPHILRLFRKVRNDYTSTKSISNSNLNGQRKTSESLHDRDWPNDPVTNLDILSKDAPSL